MIVLGIDPGSARLGYGIIESSHNRLVPLAYGVIEPPVRQPVRDWVYLESAIADLIHQWKPERASIEKLYFANNKTTAMAVSEARGIAIFSFQKAGLPIIELTPLQIKQHITGHGTAPKDQLQRVVRLLLRIDRPIRPDDAADALAIAICGSLVHMPT